MTRFPVHASLAAVLLLAASVASITASAQQQPTGPRLQGGTTTPTAKAPLPAAREGAGGSDTGLRQRVDALEEQLVDMQAMVGTLESLAKGVSSSGSASARANPGAAAAFDGADAGRLDGLETQIRAMAAQIEQLQEQVRSLGGRSGALTTSATSVAGNDPQQPGRDQPGRAGRPTVESTPLPDKSGFGAVTVSPDGGRPNAAKKDDIGSLIEPSGGAGGQVASGGLQQSSGGQQGGGADDPKALYSTAYGYLIQRDYAAAETAFDDFLRQYPNHALAGNAIYWMGESLFVRGQYRAAASAFLKGYQTYAKSEKAPESLLKLAMSLQRLGQKDAACSSFSELSVKFPNAPARVKSAVQSERQRAGCT
jgi:tol-pal system protein YbgF